MAIDANGMYDNVALVGVTAMYTGEYRVTLRDKAGAIIRDEQGELEQQDLRSRTAAEREAKRLAKVYRVSWRHL